MSAKRRDPDGFSKAKATGEGFSKSRAAGDDDVEGHSIHRAASDGFSKAKVSGEGFSKSRAAGDEDDVEGHAFNRLRSPSSRGE
jgi:hypothetical protein